MRYGEIVELGRHRLMCGDATLKEDVMRLVADCHAKLLFTSPPYADIYDYSGNDLSPKHLAKFIPSVKGYADILCVNLGLKKRDHEIITYWDDYIYAAHECGLKMLSWNVWDKKNPGSIGSQNYMFPLRHEFIFVFGEKRIELNRTIPKSTGFNKRKYARRRTKTGDTKYTTINPYNDEANKRLGTVIEQQNVKPPVWGAAQMPVELAEEYIKAITQKGDYVIDCFGGSGTTLIACEMTGRKCLMMEISPDYCDVICRRYYKLTEGKLPLEAANAES